MSWKFFNSSGQDTATVPDGAVTFAKMAVNSINSDQYVDASIDTAHIGNLQITNALMADDAVNSDELAAGAVDLAHLSASGSASSSTFLRGDNSWAAAGGTTHTTGTTNVHVVNDATTGVTLNDDYKFTMVMPSSGEGFFFKCADQGSEHSALFYADYPSQITKIAGSSTWDVLNGGQTDGGEAKFYVVSDADSRTITVFNRIGSNKTITVHGMGRLASVTAQASI